MKIVFIGGFFPKELRNEIEDKSVGVIQYAADALQWAIVEGLDKFLDNLRIFNLLYIGSYPKRYKDYKIKKTLFSHSGKSEDINIGFFNWPLYKLFSRYLNLKRELFRSLDKGYDGVLVIYAIHTPFLKAAIDFKKRNKDVKICLIVPDLPEFMSDDSRFVFRLLKKIESIFLKKYLKEVDTFVLLSDHMADALEVRSRPWVRVEGVFNSNSASLNKKNKKEKFKTIFYSGTLAKRYGILNLLEAFSMIKDTNYRLWICGDGDARETLEEYAKDDDRIVYYGQIKREEVLELQAKATILVNPRTSEGEYTKYSFPSKTMEYLASGTPCVMYKLPAIPQEYHEYCYFCEHETVEGLHQTIVSVCEKSSEELYSFGQKAKEFIFNDKSGVKQSEKIYNLLKAM